MKRLFPMLLVLAGCGDCSDPVMDADAADDGARFEREMGNGRADAGPVDASVPGDDLGGADGGAVEDATTGCDLEVAHLPVSPFEIGGNLDIVAEIDPAPTTVTLHYRRGHESDFSEVPMTDAGAGSWLVSLPPVVVTFSGIDYWIEATAGDCTTTSPPANPQDDPHHIDVIGEHRVTQAAEEYEYAPDVWERYIVYAQDRADGRSDDIILYDIDTLQARKITDDARAQGTPRIFGRNVAFVDDYGDNPEIALYDLETETYHRVTTEEEEGQYGLELDGHIIVWRDDRNRGNTIEGDIYGYDLGADQTFGTADDGGELELVRRSRDQTAPKVHVDADGRVRIVYASMWDDTDGVCDAECDWNVYFIDFGPDGRWGSNDDIGPIQLTSDPNEQTSPVIWGTRIAWLDARGGNWLDPDIWTMDLGPDGMPGTADDEPARLLDLPVNDPDDLAIWESTLIWEDYRTMGFELYTWDFVGEVETQLTDIAGGQFHPEIWSNVVVWQDARNNAQGDLFDDVYVRVLP